MHAKRTIEIIGAAAAVLAGILWMLSAWYGRAEAPVISAGYDYSTPEESGRLRNVQTAGKFNFYAALAAALAAFAQGASLWIRDP